MAENTQKRENDEPRSSEEMQEIDEKVKSTEKSEHSGEREPENQKFADFMNFSVKKRTKRTFPENSKKRTIHRASADYLDSLQERYIEHEPDCPERLENCVESSESPEFEFKPKTPEKTKKISQIYSFTINILFTSCIVSILFLPPILVMVCDARVAFGMMGVLVVCVAVLAAFISSDRIAD